MRYLAISLIILSVALPKSAEAFTSGLFKLMKIGGNSSTTEETISNTPQINLSLIVEANTYTPDFYKGRAEPTTGSIIRLVVIPSDSSSVVKYVWNINGNIQNQNENAIEITVPTGVQEVVVNVTAVDKNGNAIGKVTEYIPVSNPSFSFYEVNPLRGPASIAIGQRLNLIGEEVQVLAEPYFLNNRSISELTASWNTGGLKNVSSANWQTINILKTENVATTRVSLQAKNLNSLSENVAGSFILGI